jgi:hypothetical protein
MNTHRVTEIQLLENDNGKRIVPLHTGKVQIGIAYTPKPTATDARWIEKHTKSKAWGLGIWIAISSAAVAGVIAVAAAGGR